MEGNLADSDGPTAGPPEPRPPSITAIVLHYAGVQLTLDCLASLAQADWPGLEVIVVDNASVDGGAQAIRAAYPSVTVIESDTNRGYAGGNNLGIQAALDAGADALLILNNDTIVLPGALAAMADELGDGIGAVAPLITFAGSDDGLIWSAGGAYDPSRVRHGRMTGYRLPVAEAGPARDTERFTGAAVLIPAPVLRSLGAFDEDLYFLYEDVDLSLRIRAAGLRIRFEPRAVVRHRVAMTQGGELSPTSFYYGVRNQLLVADRFAAAGGPRRLWRALGSAAMHTARAKNAPDRAAALKATWSGLRDYARGRTGARPA